MSITVKRIVKGVSYAVAPADGDTSTCPQCCHKVDEFNQRFRARLAKIHGKENLKYGRDHPTRCARNAKFMVADLPMCKTHAASYLLNLHLKGKVK